MTDIQTDIHFIINGLCYAPSVITCILGGAIHLHCLHCFGENIAINYIYCRKLERSGLHFCRRSLR